MTDLPYSSSTSGASALAEIEKILRKFNCTKFAHGTDWETGEVFIQFEHRGRMVNLKASAKGYAAAWLKANPWTTRHRNSKAKHESNALNKGSIAVYSILRDWVKAQTTLIECNVMSFEAAFLSHIMLPNGRAVFEEIQERGMLALENKQEQKP